MKFGIIGAGKHAQNRVMPAIVKAGHEVSAIYSRNPDKAKEIGLKYLSKPYDDLETFFTGGFEAVYIASPNHLHYEHAMAALRRGKHVLLEKHMTLKESHAEELVKLAGEKGLTLKIGFHMRFHPGIAEMRKMIAEGKIGKPTYATGTWAGSYSLTHPEPDRKWWDEEEKVGGGSVMGTGVHVVDTINFALGKLPKKISASRFPEKQVVERTECIYLGYDGFTATAISSRDMKNPDNSIYVYGTEGTVAVRNVFGLDVDSELVVNGKSVETYKGVNMYEEEVKAFYAATRGEETVLSDGSDGLQIVRIVNAAFEGDYNGKWINL